MAEQSTESWALIALKDAGIDIDALSLMLPKEMSTFLYSPESLTVENVAAILLGCETLLNDPYFGLHLSDHCNLSNMGIYGYLMLNARTVGEFLELATAYYSTIYKAGSIFLTEEDNSHCFEYRFNMASQLSTRHDTEWTLGYFLSFLRSKIGEHWYPEKVTFIYNKPENTAEIEKHFGKNILFNQTKNSFYVANQYVDFTINETDENLLNLIKYHADILMKNIKDTECFKSHVTLLIMEGLSKKVASAENIATQLNMSLSTFKRRLTKNKLTFRALRDNVIKQLSQKALLETNVQISVIALQMGYSELSAFDHAFSRLCGISPRKFRDNALNHQPYH